MKFKENKFSIVRNIIQPNIRDFVTQYALFDEMQDFSPDGQQVVNAHAKYADPAMEVMLLLLHPFMEEATELKLYPTYSFYRVYRNGDVLHPHKDREPCEISATVCLNYSYDDSKYNWPIYMDGHKAELKKGDLLIYRGTELEHWREPFDINEDAWQVQAFFHYVDANGPYADFKFDKRECIGSKKN